MSTIRIGEIKGMRKGGSGRPTRPVQQIDENGKVIEEFPYMERACKKLGIGNKSGYNLLQGKRDVIRGIRLRYKSQEDIAKDLDAEVATVIGADPSKVGFVYNPPKTTRKIKRTKRESAPVRGDQYMIKTCPRCKKQHSTLCDGMGVAYKRLCTPCTQYADRVNESTRTMAGSFT